MSECIKCGNGMTHRTQATVCRTCRAAQLREERTAQQKREDWEADIDAAFATLAKMEHQHKALLPFLAQEGHRYMLTFPEQA